MTQDKPEPTRRYDGPSLKEMGFRPEDCGTGHPHIDARVLDLCRLIVQKIEEDRTRLRIAIDNLNRQHERQGRLSRASREWVEILATKSWPEVRSLLLEESDEGQRLRSSHPFYGLVTDEERETISARHPPPGAPPDWRPPPAPPPDVLVRLLADTPLLR